MLFPSLLPLAAVGWISSMPADPAVVTDAAQTLTDQTPAAPSEQTVDVPLFDINHQERRTVTIGLDGTIDGGTQATLERMFRCKRTQKRHAIDQGLLAMIADVSSHYPGKTLEYVSAFRALDRHTSRHWQGRAFDFRIPGVPTTDVRDYVWTHHTHLGLGWYPEEDFIHMDHRPDDPDYAWTHHGRYDHGNPSWAAELRVPKHHQSAHVDRVGS
ncbi:MAG TPA: DUF882 domain-containing protein [Kofleriaceae bacterium]|nr:DUF882 domain-containing protein [Kofleriaceae bacterium]